MSLEKIKHINPTNICDIGANVGGFAKECKQVWPDSSVYCVEANPACEPALAESGFPYWIALLSDSEREVIFYQRKCGGTSTGDSYKRELTDYYSDENLVQTPMMTTTLDKMFEFRQNHFDCIKIDAQGAELDILRGGESIVKHAKHIMMEVPVFGAKPYNLGAPTHSEVMSYMGSIGFKAAMELETIVHPLTREPIQKDILFSRE